MNGSQRESAPSSRSLCSLPAEIITRIIGNLGQIDALILAKTGKCLLEPCILRLYNTIVVDSSYTQFSKEFDSRCTYINSSYNLRRFFKTASRHYIRSLYVRSLPNSANVYDPETNAIMLDFFSGLYNLRELVWTTENFTLEYLNAIPNPMILERLGVHITFAGQKSVCKQFGGLKSLKHLQLRPFCNSAKLHYLLYSLLGKSGQTASTLETIEIARSVKDSATSAHTEIAPDTGPGTSCGTLHTLFSGASARRLHNLTTLSVNSIVVGEVDARLLIGSESLDHLTTLALKNVAEISRSRQDGAPGFLQLLAPFLGRLKHLHLDYRENTRDTTVPFLGALLQLTGLDLVVRMNESKRQNVDEKALFADYGATIAQHSQLRKLSLEIREEHPYCEVLTPVPRTILCGIRGLHALRCLRLSCVETSANESFMRALLKLSSLEFLDMFGLHTGSFPNLGLGMAHPNVFDEWYKVQHYAREFQGMQPALGYVRINECVFECKGDTVIPRDTIERWFEEQVRI